MLEQFALNKHTGMERPGKWFKTVRASYADSFTKKGRIRTYFVYKDLQDKKKHC